MMVRQDLFVYIQTIVKPEVLFFYQWSGRQDLNLRPLRPKRSVLAI